MPDMNGVLSLEDKEKATEWLKTRMIRHECPVCGSRNWTIADHLVSPTAVNATSIGLSTPYPQIMLISECGYTHFFNAVVIGVIPRAS